MALDKKTLDQLAEHLHNCQIKAQDTPKITDDHPDMDWDDAYAIQDRILAAKLARGARVAGYKAGLTSHAKMKQMGVTDPVFGFLVDEFTVAEGAEIKVSELIHPKVEPEIAFVTRTELKGPGCSIASVLAASDLVLPGIEVIDSRYRDFKFDLKSVVADNTSASRFVVGGRAVDARSVDLRTTGMEFASELVVKAELHRLKITEVPTRLAKDGRGRPPHLNSWRDGWRHLRFLLLYCPRWLYYYPGLTLLLLGLGLFVWLLPGVRTVAGVSFDVHTLVCASGFTLLGFQALTFGMFARVFAASEGLHPRSSQPALYGFYVEKGIFLGLLLILGGIGSALAALEIWRETGYGPLEPSTTLRLVILAVTLAGLGGHAILSGFFLGLLDLGRRK